jgi:hypothetical protein
MIHWFQNHVSIILRSLHDVLEINTYRAGHDRLSPRFGLRTVGRIWMKFGMDIMPLGSTLKSYFSIFYNR